MAVRTEMKYAIDYLRMYGQAASDDEFLGVTYWTDEQLQDILDTNSEMKRVALTQYTDTVFACTTPRHLIFASDVAPVDINGAEIAGSVYVPQFNEWTVPAGSANLFIVARQINLFEALATLWDAKANQRFDYNNFKAGNNRIDIRQEYEACLRNRDHYRSRTIRRFPRLGGRFTKR